MQAFSAILAILNLVPQLAKWFEGFVSWYVDRQINSMDQENRDAIRKAVFEHDQRDLESATGSQHPGEPSGIPGTVLRDTLPGVPRGELPNTPAN